MCAAKEEKKKEFGIKIVNGKTVIQYANGVLTENGFEIDYECDDSTDDMCHWVSNDMSMKTEDLKDFLDFVINSKYLSDGLLWGIALNTWPVISRQLQETKFSKPIVFFIGEPATLKTSIARMFLTTGTYRNGLFKPYEVSAFKTQTKFEKQTKGISSSLILMDDLHEVKSYNSKDKMQGNIDTISLLITAENNVNLNFTESFLQRVVLVNFSSMINEDIDEKERYFDYIESKSDGILNILTDYQTYLLKSINDGKITANRIKEKRREKRKNSYNDNVTKTSRNIDIECIFDIAMETFCEFILDNSNISDDIFESFSAECNNTKNKISSDFNFYKMTFEQKIYHCLKLIGSKGNLFITKPQKSWLCRNFKMKDIGSPYHNFCDNFDCKKAEKEAENNYDIYLSLIEDDFDAKGEMERNLSWNEARSYKNYDNDDNSCDYKPAEYKYIRSSCNLSVTKHKFCTNKDIRESYWPTYLYLKEDLGMTAILIEDHQKISFIPKSYFREDEHYSLLIANTERFIYAIRDIYEDECRKYKIKPDYLPKMKIIHALNNLGIIGYTKLPHYRNGESGIKNNYEFQFPDDKAYILKLPKDVYKAINSNAEKFPNDKIYKDNEDLIFQMLKSNTDKILYETFDNFNRIKFLPYF